MKNTTWTIKTISSLVAISAPVLTIIYFGYSASLMSYFFPLPTLFQFENILYQSTLCSWLLFLPATIGISLIFKAEGREYQLLTIFIGFLIGIPICCLCAFSSILSSKVIADTKQLNGHKYNLVMEGGWSDFEKLFTIVTIYKCDNHDKKCEEVFSRRYERFIGNAQLVSDIPRQELHLFYLEAPTPELIFTYSANPHYSDLEDNESIDTKEISLYSYQLGNSKIFFLAICDETDMANIYCDVLPFQYSTNNSKQGYLLQSNEGIQVIVGEKLVYVNGDPPRCYADGCIIYK